MPTDRVLPADHAARSRNRTSPEGWDTLHRLARQRVAIEDAILLLEDSVDPRAIAARLRLARA